MPGRFCRESCQDTRIDGDLAPVALTGEASLQLAMKFTRRVDQQIDCRRNEALLAVLDRRKHGRVFGKARFVKVHLDPGIVDQCICIRMLLSYGAGKRQAVRHCSLGLLPVIANQMIRSALFLKSDQKPVCSSSWRRNSSGV